MDEDDEEEEEEVMIHRKSGRKSSDSKRRKEEPSDKAKKRGRVHVEVKQLFFSDLCFSRLLSFLQFSSSSSYINFYLMFIN